MIKNDRIYGIIGSVIGDIAGSRFEFEKGFPKKNFKLFGANSSMTDDSVLTIAVADAILNNRTYPDVLWEWGKKYPAAGFGRSFKKWLKGDKNVQNTSAGDGSGMRIGPVGFRGKTLDEVLSMSKEATIPTHNSVEGIKAAQAIATSVFLAREGKSKAEIKKYVESQFGYNLDMTDDDIRGMADNENYNRELAEVSTPIAIIAFLRGEEYEDVIRTAVTYGGDTDTVACMAGSIAAAFYGVPVELAERAAYYIPKDALDIINAFDGTKLCNHRVTPPTVGRWGTDVGAVYGCNTDDTNGKKCMNMNKRILGTGNIALDIIYQREYPEGFDTAKKRNPFVDKLIIVEVGNTCGNVMTMLPYLGVETYPIGHFDDTRQGLKITADLKHYGANTRFVNNSPNGGTALIKCTHKLDQNGRHTIGFHLTSPNSRFVKRKYLRKDQVPGFLDQLDFKPDAYFFDVTEAGPRELAKALKEQGVLVYYEPEGNKEMNKFLRCVEASDIVKFSGTHITDVAFADNYPDKLFIRTMGDKGMMFNLRGQGWKNVAPVPNPNEVDWEGAGDWTTSVILAELCKMDKLNIAQLTEDDVRKVLETAATIASRSVSYMSSKGMIHDKI